MLVLWDSENSCTYQLFDLYIYSLSPHVKNYCFPSPVDDGGGGIHTVAVGTSAGLA